MSGMDWEGVLGSDDPEEYMDILENEIAEADQYLRPDDDNYSYRHTVEPPKPYKTQFSVSIAGVDEFVNLGMGFKSYKTFNKFADEQNLPNDNDLSALQDQIEKLFSFEKVVKAGSLFIVPSIDFNLSNQFASNNEFSMGNLAGKVNVLSFLMDRMMRQYSSNDYLQKNTGAGTSYWIESASIKTIYIFNGVFRKEMKKPLEDYVKELRNHYGDDVKVVLIALTEAQSRAIHFRLDAEDLPDVITYDGSVGFKVKDLVRQLPEDLKNKGLLLYNSNPEYDNAMQQLNAFNKIQDAKQTLHEDITDLYVNVDCVFDSYTGRVSTIYLSTSDELQKIMHPSQIFISNDTLPF